MPDPVSAKPPSEPTGRNRRLAFAGLLLLAIAGVLLLRNCGHGPPVAFDWFQAKADELGRDPARVARFLSDEVRTLAFHGDVKGALGTLWEGAGSPEEKRALEAALLAHCPSGNPPAADGSALTATILHRGARETVVYQGPIGDLVGDVHSIESVAGGKSRITIRAKQPSVTEVDAGAEGEDIVWRVQRPGGDPLEVDRELWRRDNRIGAVSAVAGDRHDFVVLPCRIGHLVREKEEQRLKEHGRDKGDEAWAYLTLLDYCLRSDLALADLERDLKVRARFDLPRILVLSRAKVPNLPGGVLALDLRLDRVLFDGASPSDAHLAVQVRSFVESGLEHHFLQEITEQPCTSTWDVFGKLDDDVANSYDRRMGLVRRALDALGDHGTVTFRGRKDGPLVSVAKAGDRFTLTGGRLDERIVQQLAQLPDAPKLGSTCDDAESTALAVEIALLGTGLPPDFLLEVVRIARDDASLVVPGARFVFHWGKGEEATDQSVEVAACSQGLEFSWRVQSGIRPVRGVRSITAHALAEATTHNPWYAEEDDPQDDATSFCVSRHLFAELAAGRSVPMALSDKRDPKAEDGAPRPIAWRGEAKPIGRATHRVRVNGREEDLKILRLRVGVREIAILDDARFPVGMADALTEIRTAIHARLVDLSGVGISDAQIAIEGVGGFRTGPDGRFVLPPSFGKVRLVVRREEQPIGEQEVDLSEVGREEVVVAMQRPRAEILFVRKDNAHDLDPLALSPQARRHVDRHLDAGYQIVIPAHRVEVDGVDVVAYYAHDVASGEMIAVTEDGLHGATVSYDRALQSLARDLAEALDKPQPFIHVHALRGAIIAWWMYGKERVGGSEHEEAIQRMLDEMDDWEKRSNLLTGLETIPQARSAMGDLMKKAGWDIDNAGASAAFKIGYIGATRFLHQELGK